jgi:hypothetical protein
MCQGCVSNGFLSQETYDKLENFIYLWPGSEFGPAHVILGDDNIDDYTINWCLSLINSVLANEAINLTQSDIDLLNELDWYKDSSKEELIATKKLLEELLEIPEDKR